MPSFLTVAIMIVACAVAGSGIAPAIRWAARAAGYWADPTTEPPVLPSRADHICVALGLGTMALVVAVMLAVNGLPLREAEIRLGLAGVFAGIFVTVAGAMLGDNRAVIPGQGLAIDYEAMERREIARTRGIDPSEVKINHPVQDWMKRMGSIGPLWILIGMALAFFASS